LRALWGYAQVLEPKLIPRLGSGGAEKQLIYLSGGLTRAGWDVHVAFTAHGPNFHLLEASGATLGPISITSNYDPMMIPRIVRQIREAQPATVQTWIPMMDMIGGPIARCMQIPWIMSERCSPAVIRPQASPEQFRGIARHSLWMQPRSTRCGPDREF
jgi:hypothetical protein